MVTAPEYEVAPDSYERLKHIVLKHKAMLADLDVLPDEGTTRDIACQRKALSPGRLHQAGRTRLSLR